MLNSRRHTAAERSKSRSGAQTEAGDKAGRMAGWADSNVTNGSVIFQNTKMYFDEDKLIYFTTLELGML